VMKISYLRFLLAIFEPTLRIPPKHSLGEFSKGRSQDWWEPAGSGVTLSPIWRIFRGLPVLEAHKYPPQP